MENIRVTPIYISLNPDLVTVLQNYLWISV